MKNKTNPDRDKIILKRNLNTWIDRIRNLWVGIWAIYMVGGLISSGHYGGIPEYVVNGRYYLGARITTTEVSRDVYEFVEAMGKLMGIPFAYSFIFAPIMVILVVWRNSILPGLGKRRAKLGNVCRSKNKTVLRWQAIFKKMDDKIAKGAMLVSVVIILPGVITKPKPGYCAVLVFGLILLSVKIGQLLMAVFVGIKYGKRLEIDALIILFLCILAVSLGITITSFIIVH
jgi:hypothetical protein